MKIKVTRAFRDKTADMKLRNIGEVFEATPERAKELITAKFAAEVKEKENSKNTDGSAETENPEPPKKEKTTKAQ